MANGTLQKPGQDTRNPEERHSDELFNDISRNFYRTTARPDQENENIERARAAGSEEASRQPQIAQAESEAARDFTKPRAQPVSAQENAPQPTQDYSNKNAQGKQKPKANTRRRNLLIGVGSTSGIILMLLGFGGIQPFRLPGIMDSIIDNAGKRIQRVVEKRGQKLLIKYAINGSKASKNVVTGGLEGKLFKHMRESGFEDDIKNKYGITFEDDNGKIKVSRDNVSLGSFDNVDDFEKALKGDSPIAKEMQDITQRMSKKEFTIWSFVKRTKFVTWLRKFTKILRFGPDERKDNETNEDYAKRQKQRYLDDVTKTDINNVNDFFNCVAESGDCETKSKLSNDEFKAEVEKAAKEAAKELAEEGAAKASTTLIEKISSKLTLLASKQAIPIISEIDDVARLVHLQGQIVEGNLLQKKHTQYVLATTSVIAATMAGNSDATKAGALDATTAGMFADMLIGWEEGQAYNIINSGEIKGVGIDDMQKLYENVPLPDFLQMIQRFYSTLGWWGRWPAELWYNTVSKVIDFAFDNTVGDATSWILQKTGAAELMASITPYIGDVFKALLSFMGLYIDPLANGAQLSMYIQEGFVGTFNQYGQEQGMRLLSHEQALAQENHIKQEKIADLAQESFFDRMLNLENSDSFANAMLAYLPTSTTSLATGSISLVASLPANFARATSASAYAAPTAIVEDIYKTTNIRGGTNADLDAPLSPALENDALTCPANSDNSFNHCTVDRMVASAADCQYVKCADMETPGVNATNTNATVTGNTQTLAQEILNRKNKITFEGGQNDGAYQDIVKASQGVPTTSPCGGSVSLDPTLLQAIVNMSNGYSFRINSLVSDHECDTAQHPKGKAVDFGLVNGQTAILSSTASLYGQFATELSGYMPNGGWIGQSQCMGPLTLKNNVGYGTDPCDHLHMQVP